MRCSIGGCVASPPSPVLPRGVSGRVGPFPAFGFGSSTLCYEMVGADRHSCSVLAGAATEESVRARASGTPPSFVSGASRPSPDAGSSPCGYSEHREDAQTASPQNSEYGARTRPRANPSPTASAGRGGQPDRGQAGGRRGGLMQSGQQTPAQSGWRRPQADQHHAPSHPRSARRPSRRQHPRARRRSQAAPGE